MKTVYIHIHIPKNAGQTFQAILGRQFGPALVHAPEAHVGHIYSASEKRSFLARHPRARCISGHAFRYPAPRMPHTAFRYLTFLRHPVDRLVSLYAYEQKLTAGSQHSSQGPLEAWIDSRLLDDNALTNFQAFHLLGAVDPAAVSLDAARRVLDGFFFVGLTERFDESMFLLTQSAGFSPEAQSYQRLNETHSGARFPLSDSARRRLMDLNDIDMALYDLARTRFESALNQPIPSP